MKRLKDVFQLILGTAYLADASRWYSASNTTNAGNYSTNSSELSQARDSGTSMSCGRLEIVFRATLGSLEKHVSRVLFKIFHTIVRDFKVADENSAIAWPQVSSFRQQRHPAVKIVISAYNDILILVKSCKVLNCVKFFQYFKLFVH